MAVYYRAVLLTDDANEIIGYMSPGDFKSGSKLLEHSWIGSEFVEAVERRLTTPHRLVWLGDGAASNPLFRKAVSAPKRHSLTTVSTSRYIVNHDQRVYVDKTAVPASADGGQLHPLPLLTVEGRTRELDKDHTTGDLTLIGTWARDRISVSNTTPPDFQELLFDIAEVDPDQVTDSDLVRDAYNRRIAALHNTITAWAVERGVMVGPADEGEYSLDLVHRGRQVTVRLIPSQEQKEPGAACVIVEDDATALRMMAFSGDSGMPTAAALKGLLTGLLIPEAL